MTRAQFLRLSSLTVLIFAIATGASADCAALSKTGPPAKGVVFHDANQNGVREPEEAGVADVSVSNGCDVVRTDRLGRYSIPLPSDSALFLTQPSGWTVPVNEHQLPQFYYLHYPLGSPKETEAGPIQWRWETVEPTGPLPESIDFALLKNRDPAAQFKAHAFADTQAGTDLAQDMLREELVNPLIDNPWEVDFSVTVGDVVYDNLGLYSRHIEMMGLLGVPSWYLPGNHDINFAAPTASLANETFKRHFGPTYYSFEHGEVHFVALNNVEYQGSSDSEHGTYRGYIAEEQLHWLEQDLAWVPRDRLIVIATHIPLLTDAVGGSGQAGGSKLNTVNFDRLIELLLPFEHVYAMAGHDTSNSWKKQIDHKHGWHGTPWIAHTLAEVRGNGWTTGPRDTRQISDAMMQDGNPNGYYVLHFDGPSVVPEFIALPTGPDAGQRLRVRLDPPLGSGDSIRRGVLQPGTKVVVNLFDGGERDELHMSVDGKPERPMVHVVRTDPEFERAYERLKDTSAAFGRPAPSSHIWELALPAGLESGVHTLTVRTLDEFGQAWRQSVTFELVDDPNR